MSSRPNIRRRVQDPKINTTINPQLTKRSSNLSVTSERSPTSPSSPRRSALNRSRSPNAVSSFWGEDSGKKYDSQTSVASSTATLKPDWMNEEEKANIKEWYSAQKSSVLERDSVVKRRKNLWETQQIMPAPGTTYFQLVVQSDRVLLRDWPRQRFSQKWTRDGGLNPGEKVFKTQYFIDGEDRDQLVYIFGRKLYDEAIEAAKNSEGAQ
ncbi:hypothetical protein BCR33DRAFT_781981 [Rhizoclosmatium globosum]|uniref:Uncharacterized protein n=1 Tax=Rhizoclosmatium globosum TaxID=329046 RepID=A0A1Y2CPM1_9FUNG|nr:hypothetical protein HDU79_010217 [Rhizoclosmatium sp. JEL0117]ORY48978.1 hypothetical protein BCR33DRAFT_781981 [Rhizoclosmatium globosum]|eukprot:ORY48978.1 hypothetical protein BCR33DRAFT_781981 [Rhizoclosmatium globosum]